MLGTIGIKAATDDPRALLPPSRTFDTLDGDAVGGLYFSFEKYGIQVESAAFTPGVDPSTGPARRPPPATARWRCRPTTSRTSTTSATTPPTAATSWATPAARA